MPEPPPPKKQTPFNVRRYFPSLYPPCLHVLRVDPDKLDTVKMDNLWAREGDDEETGLLLGALAPSTACRLCCGMPCCRGPTRWCWGMQPCVQPECRASASAGQGRAATVARRECKAA